MNEKELLRQWEKTIPPVPQSFHSAMRMTLDGIVGQEKAETHAQGTKAGGVKKRILIYALVAALLLAVAAIAATLLRYDVFSVTIGRTPQNGEDFIKRDLARLRFEHCDVEIKEAAYDGVALYIVYSIRDRDATEPLGEYDEESGMWLIASEGFPAMQEDRIGWWCDQIWIDGKGVDMPNMSGGMTMGSEKPGELLFYMQYRLDQVGLYLGDSAEISLPIGRRPEDIRFDRETGEYDMPENRDAVVSFTLDTRVERHVYHPAVVTEWDEMSACVAEVIWTPMSIYLTVDIRVKEEAVKAYREENGEGYVNEEGLLLWEYGPMEISTDWILSLDLVDGEGKRVFEKKQGFDGNQGYGNEQAWFTYAIPDPVPERLYLAPFDGADADMTRAIRVR